MAMTWAVKLTHKITLMPSISWI